MDEELLDCTVEELEELLELKRECQDEGDDYYIDDEVKDDCYYAEWDE